MADIFSEIGKIRESVEKLSRDGVPITVEHKFDLPSVAYFAGFMLIVGLLLVVASGVKDGIVKKMT